MTAGQIWRRPGGLRWVEVQTAAVDPSGWRLMVPLVDAADAPDAPPLVVTLDKHRRGRVHLLCAAPAGQLGRRDRGRLSAEQTAALQAAVAALVDPTLHTDAHPSG